jgi:hypothetical protein
MHTDLSVLEVQSAENEIFWKLVQAEKLWNFATVIFSYTMMTDEARASQVVMMSNVLMLTGVA